MYHHRPKKESNECQTDLQCTPFILNENETARVHSTRLCQTEVQLSPRAPDTELYKLIPYTDECDIERDAIRSVEIARKRKIKLQFFLPITKSDTFIDKNDYKYIITDGLNEGVTYLTENENLQRFSNQSFFETQAQKPINNVDSVSSVGTLKSAIKKILKEDGSTQTDLMIAPHILNDSEKAIITVNTSCQTSVTCSPRTSLTNVVPMLKNYWEHQGEVREPFNKTENVLEILREIIQDVINIHQHMFDQHYNLPIMNPVLIQIGQTISSKDSSEWETVSTSKTTKKNVVDVSGDGSFENTTLSEMDSIKNSKLKESPIESISTISEVSTLNSSDFTLTSTIENEGNDDDDDGDDDGDDDNDTDDVSNILNGCKKKYTNLNSEKSEISSKVQITQSEPTVSKGIDPAIRSKKYLKHKSNTESLESELSSENDSKRYLPKDTSNNCDTINSKCVCSGINIKLCLKDKSDDNNKSSDRFIEMKVKANLESIEIQKLLNISTEPELAGTNIPFQEIENLLVEKINEIDSTEGLARLFQIEDQPESVAANIHKTDSFRITINMPKNTVLSPQTTSEQFLHSFLLTNFILKDIENVPYPEIVNKISYPSKTCPVEKQLCPCSCSTDVEKNTEPKNKKTVSETQSPFTSVFGQLCEDSEKLIPFDSDEFFCVCKNDGNEVLLHHVEYEMPPSNTNLEFTGTSTTDAFSLKQYQNVDHEINKTEFPVSVRSYAEAEKNLKSMSSYVFMPTRPHEPDYNRGNSIKEMYRKSVKIQDHHDINSISYEGHVYITDSFFLPDSSDDSVESVASNVVPEEVLGKSKKQYPEISYEEFMYKSDSVPTNSDNSTTDLNCICTQELHQIVGECPHCFRRIGPQYRRDQRLTMYDQPVIKEQPDDYCSMKQNIPDGYKKGFNLPFANQFTTVPTKKIDSSRNVIKMSESYTAKVENLIETKNITIKFKSSEENVRKNIDATVDSRGNVHSDIDDPSKHIKLIEKVYSTGKIVIGKMNTEYFDATNLNNTKSKSNCNYENESYPQVHCKAELNHGCSAVEDKTTADKKDKYKAAFKTKCHTCLKAKLKQSNKNSKFARIQNTSLNKDSTPKEAKYKAASKTNHKTCPKTKGNEILTIHGICSICSSNEELDEKPQCNAKNYKPFISDTMCNRGTGKSEIKLENKRSIDNLQKLMQTSQLIGSQQNKSNAVTKKCLSCSNLLNKDLHISSNLLQPNHQDKSCKKSTNTVQVIHPSKSENFNCICIKNKCRLTENIESSVCLVKKEIAQKKFENIYSSCTTSKQEPIQYKCSQILKQVKKKLDNLPDKQKNVKYLQCPGPPYNSLQTNCKCSKCIRSEPQFEVNKSTFHSSKCQNFSHNSVQKIFERNLPCSCSSSSVNQNKENSNCNFENLTELNPCFGKCNKNNDTSKNTTGIIKDNVKEKHILPEDKMFNSKNTENSTRHMEVEKMLKDEIDDAELISTFSITTQPKVQILQIPKYIYKSYSSVSSSQFVLDANDSICTSYNSINPDENSVKKVQDSQNEFSLANVSKSDKNVKKIMNIHKLDGKYSVFSIEKNHEMGDSETTVYILPNAVFSSLVSVPAPHFLRELTESEIDDIIQFSYLRNIHYERNPEFDQRTNATANSNRNSVELKNIIADQKLSCTNCACSCSLSVLKNQEQQTDENIDYIKVDKTTSIANLQENENKVHVDTSLKTNSVGIQSSYLLFHSKPHLEKISSNLEQTFKKKKYFIDNTLKLLKNTSHKIDPNFMRIMGKFLTWKDLINSNLYRPIPIQNVNTSLKPLINFANQNLGTGLKTTNISSISELPEPSTAPPLTIEASTSTGNLEMETSILSSSRHYLSENLSLIDMHLQYPTTSDSSLSTANKILRKHMFKTPSTTLFLKKKVSPTLTLEASTSTSQNQGIVQTEEVFTSKLPDNPIFLSNISPPDKKLIEKAFVNTSTLKLPTHKTSSSLTNVTSLYKHTTSSSTHKLRTQSLIKIAEPSTYKVETNIGISSTKIVSPHINSTLGELLESLVKSQETSTNDITSMTKITVSNISKLEETSFPNLESMESCSQIPLTRDQTSCLSLPKVESQYSISESICDVTDTDTNFNKYDSNKQEWSNSQNKNSLQLLRKFIYKTSSSENVSLSVNSERENVYLQNTLLKSELVQENNERLEENTSPSASSNSVDFSKSKDVVDTKLLPDISTSNYINSASLEPNEEVEYNKLNIFDKNHNVELETNTKLNNSPLYPSTSRDLERDENVDENLQLENLLIRAIDAYAAYLTLKKGISSNLNVSKIDSPFQEISSESEDNNLTCSKRKHRISSLDSIEKVDSIYSYLDYIKDKDKSPLKLSNISSFNSSRDFKTDDFISKIEDVYLKLIQRKEELSSSKLSASNNYSSLKQDTSNQNNKTEEEISILNRDLHISPDNKIKTGKGINSVKSEYSDILKREEAIHARVSRKFNPSLFSLKSEEDYLRSTKEKKLPQRSTALTVSNYTDIISKNENGTSLKRPNSPYQQFNRAAQNTSDLKSDKLVFNNYSAYLEKNRITSEDTSARNLQSISKDRSSRNSMYLKKEEAISPRMSTSKIAPNYSNSVVNNNSASSKNSATSRLSSFVRNGISNALLNNIGDSPQNLSEESIVLPEIALPSNRVLDVVQSCEQRLQPIKSALKDIKMKLKELNMPEVNSMLQTNHSIDENKACIYLPSPPSPSVNNHCSYKTKMTFQLKKPIKPLSVTENVNPFSIKHKYILNDADNNHSTLNTNYSSVSDRPHYVQRTSMNPINHHFNQPFYSENKQLYAQNKSYSQRHYPDTYVERLHRARQPVEVIEEDLPFSPKDVERLKASNEFQRYQYLPDSYEMHYYQAKSESFNDYVVFPPNVKNSRVYIPVKNSLYKHENHNYNIQNMKLFTGDYPVWKNKHK